MEVGTMVVGIDSHKETVAACVVDELGGELATAIFPNTGAGHDSLLMWARSQGKVSLFGIEGSGGVGYALARRLATLGRASSKCHPSSLFGSASIFASVASPIPRTHSPSPASSLARRTSLGFSFTIELASSGKSSTTGTSSWRSARGEQIACTANSPGATPATSLRSETWS